MRKFQMWFLLSLLFVSGSVQAQTVAELRLTGSFQEGLSWISNVREMPDGTLIVADPLARTVLRINLKTGVAETLGRIGGGPSEYRQPDRVLPMAGDSTLLVDLGNGRFSIIGPDGSFVRTMGMGRGNPDDDQGFVVAYPKSTDGTGGAYFQPDRLLGPGAVDGDSAMVSRLDLASGRVVSIANVKLEELVGQSSRQNGGMATMLRPIPLSRQDDWAVGFDGAVAIIQSLDYHIDWIFPDGSVVRGNPMEYEPVRIRREEQEEWISEYQANHLNINRNVNNGQVSVTLARGLSSRRQIEPRQFEWPDFMPPFRAGHSWVSPRGDVWVERSVAAGSQTAIDVFDRSGSWSGSLSLPHGRHVVGFGNGTVFLTHADEYGLHWLERFQIDYAAESDA